MRERKIVFAVGTGVVALLAVTGISIFLQINGRQHPVGQNAMMKTREAVVADGPSVVPSGMSLNPFGNGGAKSVPVGSDVAGPVTEAKIVRQGNVSIRVENANDAVEKIRGAAEWFKGSVFSADVADSSGNGIRSGVVVIKVPSESFMAAMEGVKKVGTIVVGESMSNQDVTSEFVDTEARLKNKQSEEEAFLKILDKASKMDDIIAVTQELSRVREEIEVMQGQLRYMSTQTDMAMITVMLSEDQKVSLVDVWRPWQEVKDAAAELLQGLRGFVNFMIVVVVKFLPLTLLYAVIFFGLWRMVRWVYRKAQGSATKTE